MARRSYFNIEALMNNHGAAGKSIVRNIMSYLPIQTLTRGLKVSKVSSIQDFSFSDTYEANLMCVLAQ